MASQPAPLAGAPDIAIVGGGMSGLCMAIQLREAGFDRFTIYESGDRIGGTWRDNTYPGCACDVPSHLYSFSFELNPEWSRIFSPGWEIQEYFERLVDKHDLGPHIRCGTEIVEARYDAGRWHLRGADGTNATADVLVSAVGALHHPAIPDIPGLGDFAGVVFHSARWNHDHDLAGRRVAVVGSAASAVQIVPAIAPRVAGLDVFQRTPNWIVPRRDRPYPDSWKRAFRRWPALARLHRWSLYWILEGRFPGFRTGSWLNGRMRRQALAHLERQVPEASLRAKLTPDYPPGCKRILVSDDYYPALLRDNVALVTSPIRKVVPQGVVTADGVLHAADTLVLATGFQATEPLPRTTILGPAGRSLAEAWTDGLEAHRTVAVPGFPNLFLLLGPNSGLGHNSIIFMVESQVRYVVRCLGAMRRRGLRTVAPKAAAAARYNARIRRDLARTIWMAGCRSWYQDRNGRVTTLWPHSTVKYWFDMRRVRLGEYEQQA